MSRDLESVREIRRLVQRKVDLEGEVRRLQAELTGAQAHLAELREAVDEHLADCPLDDRTRLVQQLTLQRPFDLGPFDEDEV